MSQYRIHFRRGDSEIEVESTDKSYVDTKFKELAVLIGIETRVEAGGRKATAAKKGSQAKPTSIAEHVRTINPKGGTQIVVAVGHYLENYGGMPGGFKTRDLSKHFKTIKFKHSNPAQAVSQAKQQGYLMDGTEPGTLQLTQSAEDLVKERLESE